MQADTYFAIGHTHTVCQDYALSGNGLVIVSDGCSSSPNTDVGARLLAHMALRFPEWWQGDDGVSAAFHMSRLVVNPLASMIDLPGAAFDATLLVAAMTPGDGFLPPSCTVTVLGDGVVFARKRNGGALQVHTVEYRKGAPYYLNYLRDAKRNARYLEEYGGEQIFRRHDIEQTAYSRGPVAHFYFDPTLYDLVGIATDGLLSFTQAVDSETSKTREPVPLLDVIVEITRIAYPTGAFVERRMKAFLSRTCKERGWQHEDDVGVGMLTLDAP